MRLCGSLLGVIGLAMLGAGEAAAASCPFERPPASIRVHVDRGRVTYHHGLDAEGIRRLGGAAFAAQPAHSVPRGLTVARFSMSLATQVGFGRLGALACAWPLAVDVTLGFEQLAVYIDREYRRGSCEYEAVRRHEDTHVAIHRDVLAKYAAEAQRYLKVAIDRRPWFAVTNQEQAREIYGLYLQKVLEAVMARMSEEDRALNGAIDQDPIYLGTQAQCSDW